VTGDASALKMVYAAWSKGTAALLLAIRDVARAHGVEDALLAEWRESLPELLERLPQAERSAAAKGWRWIGELEEIADTFAAAGQPEGFHRAAAEVYRS
jgi:transposase-like protein